ncbi:unnamed protein product [Danaus chrysippus]|uniref:(African queen) hypothetical protein n=1 Tax=Danaus chrysippus TaxID=151541 RepID=A0A8J2VRD5_9NEOP|nr:unnamed protein product [Danaus chrysippus]
MEHMRGQNAQHAHTLTGEKLSHINMVPSGALAAGTIASPWSTAVGAPDTNGSGGADAKHLDVGDASDDEKIIANSIQLSHIKNYNLKDQYH